MTVQRQRAVLPLFMAAAMLLGQQPEPPRPPQVQFVTVEPNVRLEVIDWGGTGRTHEADVLREMRTFLDGLN